MSDENALLCPACGAPLTPGASTIDCDRCGARYPVEDGIPLLFVPNDWDGSRPDITGAMKQFYEGTPFPDYDAFDDVGSFVVKARQGRFAQIGRASCRERV